MKYLVYLVCLICARCIRIQVHKTICKGKNCIDDDEYDYQPIIIKDSPKQSEEFENSKRNNISNTITNNLTQFIQLKKTVDIQSQLTEQQQQQYQEQWINWKNSIKYYSQIFSEKGLMFSPQIPSYQIQLNRSVFFFETVPLFMVGFAIFYCLFNYKFRQIDWLNRQDQIFNLSNIINISGLLLLFAGSGMTIINLSNNRDITWDSNIKLRDISFKNYMSVYEIKTHLKLFQNVSLYDDNQRQLQFNLTDSFNILSNYEQIPKAKINSMLWELENQETIVFKSVYLLVAILISLNVNHVVANQFGTHFKLYIGLMFLIMSCWGFIVTGIMYKNVIQSIDICQQSQEIVNRQLPDEGAGYRYYIQCPTDDPNIQNLKQQMLRSLSKTLTHVKTKLINVGYAQDIAQLNNIDQLFKLMNQPKLQNDPYVANYNAAINQLNLAVQKLEVLQKCGYLMYFCKYQQRYQCYEGTQIKYNILIGLFLISISSYFSSIACLHWHVIYIKKKHDLEAQKEKIIVSNLSSQQR